MTFERAMRIWLWAMECLTDRDCKGKAPSFDTEASYFGLEYADEWIFDLSGKPEPPPFEGFHRPKRWGDEAGPAPEGADPEELVLDEWVIHQDRFHEQWRQALSLLEDAVHQRGTSFMAEATP